jgi:hypothetical protein
MYLSAIFAMTYPDVQRAPPQSRLYQNLLQDWEGPLRCRMQNAGLLAPLSGSLAVMSGLTMVTKHLALSVQSVFVPLG